MDMTPFYKSVLDQDRAPVVLCGTDHTILYMNPAALKRYESRGGAALLGRSLLECHRPETGVLIEKVLNWFRESPEHNLVFESRNDAENKDVYMVALRGGDGALIGYYEKHEYRTPETAGRYEME